MGRKTEKKFPKRHCIISVLILEREKIKNDKASGGKRYSESVDFKENYNEYLDITYMKDDSVKIQISGVIIQCHKSRVQMLEEKK